MSYPKGSKKKIKIAEEKDESLLVCSETTYSPPSPPIELAKALAANYANKIASEIAAAQPMNDVSVNDLAVVFAITDQMKKNRESS